MNIQIKPNEIFNYAKDLYNNVNENIKNMNYDIIINMPSVYDNNNLIIYVLAYKFNYKHIISDYEYTSIVYADDDLNMSELENSYINGYKEIEESYYKMEDDDKFDYSVVPRKYLKFFKNINWNYVNSCSFDELVELFNMKNVLIITDEQMNEITINKTNIYKLGVSHVNVITLKELI